MSLYKNEHSDWFRQALDSILNQTVKPDEIVIVKDGLLTSDLENVLKEYLGKYSCINVLPFEENRGLGLALRDGVLACKNEWIARMDTDDISHPKRFEKQLAYIEQHEDISLLGAAIEEFSFDYNIPDSRTILPLKHDDIVKFAKKRNPFRHMTVIFNRNAVLNSGNYRHFLWFEDYDLWVRLILAGYKTANLPDVLVSVRADESMFSRRGGFKYLLQDLKFQIFIYKRNFINILEFLVNIITRGVVRLLPNNVRIYIYKIFLRNRIENE